MTDSDEPGANPGGHDLGVAFARHYRSVAPALATWARLAVAGALREVVDPDDLVQDICYQAYRSFSRFDDQLGSFRPWLFGVANHVLQMLLRKHARAQAQFGGMARLASQAGSVPAEATSISRRVARNEILLRFAGQVAELPEEDRRLLVWRGLEGLGHQEVARLMGLSVEAVTKRWNRLRQRLAELDPEAGLVAEG